MIKSLIKIFHLPTDTLRIILISFSSRLNDQSIKEIRLRIARTLNWVEGEILFFFSRTAQPIQVRSSSTNIRSPYSLPQLAEHPVEHTITRNRANYRIGLRVSFYFFT